MQTASYSHWLHNQTAFSQIQKNDSYLTSAWKVPVGRILCASVALSALIETLIASIATALASPLYILDSDRFNIIAADAADSAKTIKRATAQFFGLGACKKTQPSPCEAELQSLDHFQTGWQKTLQFLKNWAWDITYVALKNPNATFVALTIGTTATVAYSLGFFDFMHNLFSKTAPKNSHSFSNMSLLSTHLLK
jgi:hypothetical protein